MFMLAKQLGVAALTGAVALTLVAPSAHAAPPFGTPGVLSPLLPPLPPAFSWPFSSGLTLPVAADGVTTVGDALGHLPGLRPGDAHMDTLNSNLRENSTQNKNFAIFDHANVIKEISRDQLTLQEARLKYQEVRAYKNQNRRQEFYDWLERRDLTPTREDERDRQRKEEIRHSLNLSPDEAPSAASLNNLLEEAQRIQALELSAPDVDLAKEVIRGINFTPGNRGGNIGLLKKDLSWPPALQDAEFQAERDLIASMIRPAVKQAINGKVDAEELGKMKDAANVIRLALTKNRKTESITEQQYIEGKRFLDQMDDALKVLQKPDAGNYFSAKYSGEGRTVAELVRSMTAKGLKFAPPVDDDAAYEALYRALAAYDAGSQFQMNKTNAAAKRSP